MNEKVRFFMNKLSDTSQISVTQLKDFQEISLQELAQPNQCADTNGYSLTLDKDRELEPEPLFGTHIREVIRIFKNW